LFLPSLLPRSPTFTLFPYTTLFRSGGIIHYEHMIGEDLAKTELGFVLRLRLGCGGAGDFDVQHDIPSFLTWRESHGRPPPPALRADCYAGMYLSAPVPGDALRLRGRCGGRMRASRLGLPIYPNYNSK